jgi:hypothetical protein
MRMELTAGDRQRSVVSSRGHLMTILSSKLLTPITGTFPDRIKCTASSAQTYCTGASLEKVLCSKIRS